MCMQNIIGGHIFHVIKAHDLTQNIFTTRISFQKEHVEEGFFLNLPKWEKHG